MRNIKEERGRYLLEIGLCNRVIGAIEDLFRVLVGEARREKPIPEFFEGAADFVWAADKRIYYLYQSTESETARKNLEALSARYFPFIDQHGGEP